MAAVVMTCELLAGKYTTSGMAGTWFSSANPGTSQKEYLNDNFD
jgi:hypothetical protein